MHAQPMHTVFHFGILTPLRVYAENAPEGPLLSVSPIAGIAVPGTSLQVVKDQDTDELSFVYSASAAKIVQADVAACTNNSAFQFLDGMLRPDALPLDAQLWFEVPTEGVRSNVPSLRSLDEAEQASATSPLRRNSTLLMSILIICGVFFLVMGVFWGRYRHSSRNSALQNTVGRWHNGSTQQKRDREVSEIVPIAGPKVCFRYPTYRIAQLFCFLHMATST